MAQNLGNSPPTHRKQTAARIGWTILILATLYVCYFSHLGAIGFVGPDEPRYAWIARAMVETGDWVTPRLYGNPWFEKPPLYYWGAALSFKLFGVSETAARLPSALSALLATLALAWLALRLYGAETARWLLLLLPTTVGMIGFSHAAATDMPFSAMLTIAMVAAAVLLRLVPPSSPVPDSASAPASTSTTFAPGSSAESAPSHSRSSSFTSFTFTSVLFGFFLGLAVLAKGPAAIILCGGAVFFWALFTKRWRDALRLLHPATIAAFCVTALPWYILCARRNPDFLRVFIIEHNFKRYLTPEFHHIQPFWFYIPVLFAAILPWTLGLLVWFVERHGTGEHCSPRMQQNLFLLTFGLFPILFFSISQSKLPGYILPAVGPLACLLTVRLPGLLSARKGSVQVILVLIALTFAGLSLGVMRFVSNRALGQDILPAPWTAEVWLPLLISGVVSAILAGLRRNVLTIIVMQIAVLIALLGLYNGSHWMDPGWSARGVITTAHAEPESLRNDNLFLYDVPRGIQYGLNFYLHREIPLWTPGLKTPGAVFTSFKGEQQLKVAGYSCPQHLVFPAAILCRKDPQN